MAARKFDDRILFGTSEGLESLRQDYLRRVVFAVLPVTAFAVGVAIYLDLITYGYIPSPVDAIGLPLLCVVFLVGLLLITWRQELTLVVSRVLFLIYVVYLAVAFAYQHLYYFPMRGSFSEVSYWYYTAYLGAFLLFPRRKALCYSLGLWIYAMAVSGYFLYAHGWGALNSVVQFHAAGLVSIGLVALIALGNVWLAVARGAATHDYLTQLPNRRYMQFIVERLVNDSERSGEPLAAILLDLDNFKKINDTLGHWAGDQVLQSVASALKSMLREEDWIGRWGGEEFLILLPGTDLERARRVAERLCRRLKELRPVDVPISGSFGVAVRKPGETPESLVRRADTALYRAKAKGKGRVEVEEDGGEEA